MPRRFLAALDPGVIFSVVATALTAIGGAVWKFLQNSRDEVARLNAERLADKDAEIKRLNGLLDTWAALWLEQHPEKGLPDLREGHHHRGDRS